MSTGGRGDPCAEAGDALFKNLPPLQLLLTFESAARLGSFKEAAGELHVTPSAISQQIRALEDALGCALFHRRHREVTLSELGRRYAESVTEALAVLDRDSHRLRQDAREPVLRVTTEGFLANEYLVPNMPAFRELAPGVDLRVETSMALVDLKREPADAAIRWATKPPDDDPTLLYARLQPQFFQLVCAPSMAKDLTIPQGLGDAPIVCLEDRYEAFRTTVSEHLKMNLDPKDLLLVDTFYGMLRAAENGQGVAFGLRPMIDPWLRDGRLVALPGTQTQVPGALYFVCLKRDAERPEMRALHAWIRGMFQATSAAPEVA
ncbi:MAG: LysR substrate-binding domain-containing protein [Myxococcales bacterium]|nr:LysR substrate-binding domain-containing protein [Myxococcales bacterium]